jgi:hypothetical protein
MYPGIYMMISDRDTPDKFFSTFLDLIETAKPTFIIQPHSLYILLESELRIKGDSNTYLTMIRQHSRNQPMMPSIEEYATELRLRVDALLKLWKEGKPESPELLDDYLWRWNMTFLHVLEEFPWNFGMAIVKILFRLPYTSIAAIRSMMALLNHHSDPTYDQGLAVLKLFDDESARYPASDRAVASREVFGTRARLSTNGFSAVEPHAAAVRTLTWADYKIGRQRAEIKWLSVIRLRSDPKTQAIIDLRLAQLQQNGARTAGMFVGKALNPKILHQLF